MTRYNKLEDETTNLIDSEISSLVDKSFKGIHDLLEEQEVPVPDRVKTLFELNEVSDALKCLLESDVGINSNSVNSKERESIEKLYNIVKLFNEEECKSLNDILEQYEEKIKEQGKDQDSKSINIFKTIKLFFQEIIAKFKSKNLEDFNDKHTVKVDNATFYYSVPIQTGLEQEIYEPDREIEEVLEQKVSKSPTLETIVEEDKGHNVEFDYVRDVQKGIYENVNFSIIPQFTQEETLHKPQVVQIREKPAIPPKSQKVIDADNKIRNSQKTETPSYTSSCTISLKPADEKPKVAPKPTVKVYTQAEKQYGKNVARKKQFFESLNDNSNSKPKVKSKVEKLKEKHESFIELASRSSIEQVASSKGR
ncbi:MAG: hypothetical protein U0X86_000589 [Wolbachia endosymbiont of Xenopsylla cheopis]